MRPGLLVLCYIPAASTLPVVAGIHLMLDEYINEKQNKREDIKTIIKRSAQ